MRRLVLVLLALALAGCGVPNDEAPRALDPSAAPFDFFERDVAPPAQGTLQVEMWFLRGEQPVLVERAFEPPGSPRQVLDALLLGPTAAEEQAGLSSAVPASLELVDLEVTDGVAVVTLAGLTEQVQVPAFAQVVATLDGRPGIAGVRFRTRDADLPVPSGDGTVVSSALTRTDYAVLLGLAPPPPPPPAPPAEPPAGPPLEPAAEPAPG
jgi:hypothetical protein